MFYLSNVASSPGLCVAVITTAYVDASALTACCNEGEAPHMDTSSVQT